jgi:hypothetical protein
VALNDTLDRIDDIASYAKWKGEDPAEAVLSHWKGVTRLAGYEAREAVFEPPASGVYSRATYFYREGMVKERAMAIARETLRSPDCLKAKYKEHRGTVLTEIRRRELGPIVSQVLFEIRPCFDQLSMAGFVRITMRQTLEEKLKKAEDAWSYPDSRAQIDELEQKIEATGVTRSHLLAYEWAERRRAEGGDELVQAWGEIIEDMAVTLQ